MLVSKLEKYLTFFYCENLVDFNEAHLHEATLNLHICMREIFSHLSIVSVDDKQRLSELVFSALVGFSLLQKCPTFGQKKPDTIDRQEKFHACI